MTVITGYKATDKNMQCRGFQFEIGKWYEIPKDEPLEMCKSGFHFCVYPSGPFIHYPADSRIFKIEAEGVAELVDGDGAGVKRVCRRIRLVEEITPGLKGGDRNTGDSNTGDSNTGDWNTGYRNTGDCNTGYSNTGYRNTGNRNTGDSNTGSGNACDNHTGWFNTKEPEFVMFDIPCDKSKIDWCLANDLASKLSSDDEFDIDQYLKLPNATKQRIKVLHEKHIEMRKKMKGGAK